MPSTHMQILHPKGRPMHEPTRRAALALALALTSTVVVAHNEKGQAHELKPLHGGVVVEGKELDYELVAKATSIQLYLRDHGKPADVSKATAKLTLLSAGQKQELDLTPSADKFEASGSFKLAPGTKAVAVVTLGGRPSTVRSRCAANSAAGPTVSTWSTPGRYSRRRRTGPHPGRSDKRRTEQGMKPR